MDVLIYVADGVIYDGLDYGARLEERFKAAGLDCARRDLTTSPLEDPPPARAYVFTGGQTSVHSPAPWMRSATTMARQLMAVADRADYAVIGICLGAQILAEALRPDSIVSLASIEVGLTPVTHATDKRVQEVVPSFHYQAISPHIDSIDDVRIEWRNEHTAVQAFSYGKRTFGCQFHPELSVADVHNLIDYHSDVVTQWHADVTATHQSVDRHAPALSADLFHRMVIDRLRR